MSVKSIHDIEFGECNAEISALLKSLSSSVTVFTNPDELEEYDKIFTAATISRSGKFFHRHVLPRNYYFQGLTFFEDNSKDFAFLGAKERAANPNVLVSCSDDADCEDESSYGTYYLYHIPTQSYVKAVYSNDQIVFLNFYTPESRKDLGKLIGKWFKKYARIDKKENSHYIWLLSSGSCGVNWVQHELHKSDCQMGDESIRYNYGEAFKEMHEGIVKSLNTSHKGVYIFNGPPGTGKTTYIKHLIGTVNKQFLYVPERLIDQIADPSFINLLMQKNNAVLILEDAERAIRKRSGKDATSAVSNILNMSDGIIGSVLRIPIIMTFNAEISDIDEAILRNGRCMCRHEFGPLSIKDAKTLAQKIGKKIDFKGKKSMTLADIYNAN